MAINRKFGINSRARSRRAITNTNTNAQPGGRTDPHEQGTGAAWNRVEGPSPTHPR